ncbi:hypothetical protein CFOL_v3_18312 [Cephalotus follicularis]|uniref:Uncharacterized protein n=1 Tax=Cephalotus follicularis TaxID=3775 RepID=A0A1Q3C457_CEPFO|nr:hypothetical protein CFOL_v3_18312 [Cephalotus follicularis]
MGFEAKKDRGGGYCYIQSFRGLNYDLNIFSSDLFMQGCDLDTELVKKKLLEADLSGITPDACLTFFKERNKQNDGGKANGETGGEGGMTPEDTVTRYVFDPLYSSFSSDQVNR